MDLGSSKSSESLLEVALAQFFAIARGSLLSGQVAGSSATTLQRILSGDLKRWKLHAPASTQRSSSQLNSPARRSTRRPRYYQFDVSMEDGLFPPTSYPVKREG